MTAGRPEADDANEGGIETPEEGGLAPPSTDVQGGAPAPQAETRPAEGAQESEDSADRVASDSERIETGPTAEQQLSERTADLQRLQAEYINYKRRVERDRETVRAQGAEAVLRNLLTVLDDVARADEHGELTGGFKSVAGSLLDVVRSHDVESFGAAGEAFNPNLHEAVAHTGTSTDVTVQSIDTVMRVGYRVGDRVLRPAVVSVVDPEDPNVAVDRDSADAQPSDAQAADAQAADAEPTNGASDH